MSPELFDAEIRGNRRTEYSDCYALGMVIYEVLSGHVPFHEYANWAVPGKVVRGDRPERPQGEWAQFTDGLWEVLERCWDAQPRNRPSVEEVLQYFEGVSSSWTPPSLSPVADSLSIDSPASITFGLSSELSVDFDDFDEGVISPPVQSSVDMNTDEGEVPFPPQPPNDREPSEGDADSKGINPFTHGFSVPYCGSPTVVYRGLTISQRLEHHDENIEFPGALESTASRFQFTVGLSFNCHGYQVSYGTVGRRH